jgi:hypothetical protein
MNNIINKISQDILTPLVVEKLAQDIACPCIEKQATSGADSFLGALSGSKVKTLKKEVADLGRQVRQNSENPAVLEAFQNYKKIKGAAEGTSIHPRMEGVKKTLDDARKTYQDTVTKHDPTLNQFVVIKRPLVLLHPIKYGKAKIDITSKKISLNNADAQYKAQEKRIKHDIKDEISSEAQKYEDAQRAAGITPGAVENLRNKIQELERAKQATRSARTITGVGAAGVAGGIYYNKKKNEQGSGPYTYDYDPYKQADEANSFIDKIAEEILHCMI